MSVTHNVKLDVAKNRMRLDQKVHVRTGDKQSQTVRCALTKDGAAYTPSSGSTAKLEILKADDTWSVSSATISGSNVSGTIPLEAMSCPGDCKRAYFRIISGSTEDTTEDFHLYVFPNAYDQAIESRPYTDQLDELIEAADQELQDMIDEVRDMRTGADGTEYESAGDALRATQSFEDTHKDALDATLHALYDVEQVPLESVSGKCYYLRSDPPGLYNVSGGTAKKYAVESGVLYAVKSSITAQGNGFPLVAYLDGSSGYIGHQFGGTPGTFTEEHAALDIPDGTAYVYVSSRNSESALYVRDFSSAGDLADVHDVGSMKSLAPTSVEGWLANTVIRNDGNEKAEAVTSKTYTCLLMPADELGAVRLADISTYTLSVVIFDENRDIVYWSGLVESVPNVPRFGHGYTAAINVRRKDSGTASKDDVKDATLVTFYGVKSADDASWFADSRGTDLDRLLHAAFDVEIEPDAVESGKTYVLPISGEGGWSTEGLVQISGSNAKKYIVETGKTYSVTTQYKANSYGVPLVVFFDANDNRIGYDYTNQPLPIIKKIENEVLRMPEGTAWFYVNERNFDAKVCVREGNAEDVFGASREVSIMFVGNSLTQDGIAYLPYMLRTFFPSVKFRLYMWYNGGHTLAQHYEKFVNDTPCQTFSVAENSPTWTNYRNSKTMAQILDTYKFDVVSVQEYFNYKETYVEADLQDWWNVADYIRDNYAGGNGLEFVSLLHAPLRSNADTVYQRTVAGNQLIIEKTVSDDIIPIGAAVYRALSTDLDQLGDEGHLSPDGTHTQEGLPCLLQTYTAMCWLLDRIGIPASVYGTPFKMTTAIYESINVPGANLGTGVIEGTTAENHLAQRVAVNAYKEGKAIVSGGLPR